MKLRNKATNARETGARLLYALEKKAHPPKAISFARFSLGKQSRMHPAGNSARELMQELGFSRLFIIHGNALTSRAGKTTVVIGPTQIGKTTATRILHESGEATPLDDDALVLGERNGELRLVTTGSVDYAMTAGRLLHRMKPRAAEGKYELPGRTALLDFLAGRLARIGAMLTHHKTQKPHEPEIKRVHEVLFFNHPQEENKGIAFTASGPRELNAGDVRDLFSGHDVELAEFDPRKYTVGEMVEIITAKATQQQAITKP